MEAELVVLKEEVSTLGKIGRQCKDRLDCLELNIEDAVTRALRERMKDFQGHAVQAEDRIMTRSEHILEQMRRIPLIPFPIPLIPFPIPLIPFPIPLLADRNLIDMLINM